jgi:hypothetical protein
MASRGTLAARSGADSAMNATTFGPHTLQSLPAYSRFRLSNHPSKTLMATFCGSLSRSFIALPTSEFSELSSFSEKARSFCSRLESWI